MRQILINPELCGWPASRVTRLFNVSDRSRLIIKLREWARDATGVFLLYYVGHGTPQADGPCLTLTSTKEDHPDVTGVEYRHIRDALLDCKAEVKIVILDCCYAGRAIPPVQSGQTLFSDIRGTYVLAAADHAAHVLENQELACTSFTGELLDLIRQGAEDAPEMLTLDDIYPRLRDRLRESGLPDPNCRGTGTAGAFPVTRNAARRTGPPIPRFPQEPAAPWWRRSWRTRAGVAAGALVLACAALYPVWQPRADGPACGSSAGTSAPPGGEVAIGSDSSAYPENQLVAQIYLDALKARGVPVDSSISSSTRHDYYDQVCSGILTVVPEYNGALLTTSVDAASTAITTADVDSALDGELPPSLAILNPAPAQDKDSITVTQETAKRYGLKSIADLSRVAGRLRLGASAEFYGREQGAVGLKDTYGVAFKSFIPLSYNQDPNLGVTDLLGHAVDAADIYTTNPDINKHHLMVLLDPKGLFRAENVLPLAYKPALRADPRIATILNYVSLRLDQAELLELNVRAAQPGASLARIASDWVRHNGLA
jgi:osmoprotectant transport system substrate-binding protein